jgi:hypothetical protein
VIALYNIILSNILIWFIIIAFEIILTTLVEYEVLTLIIYNLIFSFYTENYKLYDIV